MVRIVVQGHLAWLYPPLSLARFIRFLRYEAGYCDGQDVDDVTVETV